MSAELPRIKLVFKQVDQKNEEAEAKGEFKTTPFTRAFSDIDDPDYEFCCLKNDGEIVYRRNYNMHPRLARRLPSNRIDLLAYKIIDDAVEKVGLPLLMRTSIEENPPFSPEDLADFIDQKIAVESRRALIRLKYLENASPEDVLDKLRKSLATDDVDTSALF